MKKIKLVFVILILFVFGLYFKFSQAGLKEGDLVKTGQSPKVYAIEKSRKHWLATTAVLDSYPGHKGKKVQVVEQNILDQYPRVKLIKLANVPKVYYLTESGLKRHLQNPEVFLSYNNKWEDITEVNQTELNGYENNELIRLAGDEKVYKIEDGQKRWIKTAEVFEQLGYDWSKIAPVNGTELNVYFTAGPITSSEPQTKKYPETLILEGPKEGAVLETTEITFRYSGTNPLGQVKDLSFETYLKGYDQSWQDQGRDDSQTFDLPSESGNYTFYVRARNEGYTDPTPASISFSIGVSPYYQKIKISQVFPNEENFRNDYLILENNSEEQINISGWRLKSRKDELTVPKATNKLRAPFSNKDYSDIKLPADGRILISMGASPQDINFRLNQCAGYLDQSDKFFPSLAKECSLIAPSQYSHLKKTCRDYIEGLDQCEIPDYTGNFEIGADSDCTGFLNEKFNYNYCFSQHEKETDFLRDEWRVFLSRSLDFLNNDTDKLILRDKNGLLVEEYSY